jgi:AcrR family transcriptional regulator
MKKKMSINETVKEALAIALLQLMKKKEISEISISEIVKVAGVGRSSFYRNFNSKEELLSSYIVDLYHEYFREKSVPLQVGNGVDVEAFLLPRFHFIKEHGDIFHVLYKRGLLYYFFENAEGDFVKMLCGQTNVESSYYMAMFSGSCAGIIRHWIERNFAESEEEMVKLFANPPKRI